MLINNKLPMLLEMFDTKQAARHYLQQIATILNARMRHSVFGSVKWRVFEQVFLQVHSFVDRLVQERRNSSALAMELRLSCTNPSHCARSSACRFPKYSWDIVMLGYWATFFANMTIGGLWNLSVDQQWYRYIKLSHPKCPVPIYKRISLVGHRLFDHMEAAVLEWIQSIRSI